MRTGRETHRGRAIGGFREVLTPPYEVELVNEMFEGVIASAAKQSISPHGDRWIASSQGLLAITGKHLDFNGSMSSQAFVRRERDVDMGRIVAMDF